tara:strand:- start:11102 stop:11275 length:174 start_codon:yes stop_codon:yes gene_type:complete
MIRSEFDIVINRCKERNLIVAQKQAEYALTLWSYNRIDEARKQLTQAKKEYLQHLDL